MRLAYLVTHPIQYQAPLLRRIASEPDIRLKVFFASDLSTRIFFDPAFKRSVQWDVPLLKGYEYEFLPAVGTTEGISFWQPMNYGLASRLKAGRFDALWVHGYMRWNHWVAMAAAKRLGMKVLVRDEASTISKIRGSIKEGVKRAFFNWLRQIAHRFLAIGSLNSSYYRQLDIPDERIIGVPYAVDNAFFQARAIEFAKQRETLRVSLGLERSRPVILYAGKMMARKRPDDLLKAYSQLSSNGRDEPRPYLLYVGDGDMRRTLEMSAASTNWNSIRFLGFKNQSELPAFYDLCDVFVMPSVIEPWGLVVNEAMNARRAIIVSDQVGCGLDLVRNGENGFAFKAGDVSDLARVLREALASPERCAEMGRQSLAIINRWSFEEDVAGLREALQLNFAT
jgi:glycosyltransferase involved in cell wall biosynthesis